MSRPDHQPILVNTLAVEVVGQRMYKLFRYEAKWTRMEGGDQIIKNT